MDLLTISEARKITEPIVYGLADDAGSIFYVGKTVSPYGRFKAHREAGSKNARLNERIKALGAKLRVVVLERSPEDINAAERALIAKHKETIVNLIGADSWVWAQHSTVPWAAGAGVHCPSVMLMAGMAKDKTAPVKAMKRAMTPSDRCKYEAALYFSDSDDDWRRKMDRWYRACREKMIACIEAQDGIVGAA